jgi:hypothetical protein
MLEARTACFVAAAFLGQVALFTACKSDAPASSDGGVGGSTPEAGGASGAAGGASGAAGRVGGGGGGGSGDGGAPSAGGRAPDADASTDGSPEAGLADAGKPPTCDAADKTDTDHDGVPDACDDDDDNDGFIDTEDPKPKDATEPGAFYTPEQILANEHVKAALAAALAAGHEVKTYTDHGAPPITGYYVKPEGEGKMAATGNGDNVGDGIVGLELRYTVSADDELASADIGYLNGALFGTGGLAAGALLRGKDNEFTIYDRHVVRCLEPGSDSAVYAIGITYAHLSTDDNFKGYWLLIRDLSISIATTGTLTDACAAEYAGDLETVGGWSESEVPRYIPTAVTDLQYMCVQGDAGYVPGESFVQKDGTRCLCDDTSSLVCGGDGG